jgi:hypothetical protein
MDFSKIFSVISKGFGFVSTMQKGSFLLTPQIAIKLTGLIIAGIKTAQAFSVSKANATPEEKEQENITKKEQAIQVIKAGYELIGIAVLNLPQSTTDFMENELIPKSIDYLVLLFKATNLINNIPKSLLPVSNTTPNIEVKPQILESNS